MKRLAILLACIGATNALANEQPKMIPLEEIWAYGMPGTRDVLELEIQIAGELDTAEFIRRHKIQQILHALTKRPKDMEQAGTAFIVTGTGREALDNAALVFNGERRRPKVLPANTELTLVFYSYLCGQLVQLVGVEKGTDTITVKYQFKHHAETYLSQHFALIPLGKLQPGRMRVQIVQVKSEKSHLIADPRRLVSNPFSFEVRHETNHVRGVSYP